MSVMNDRPQGASAYRAGSIEVAINRRGYTNDNLGMPEALNDVDSNNQGINVSTKFILKFSTSRPQVHTAIHKNFFRNLY